MMFQVVFIEFQRDFQVISDAFQWRFWWFSGAYQRALRKIKEVHGVVSTSFRGY